MPSLRPPHAAPDARGESPRETATSSPDPRTDRTARSSAVVGSPAAAGGPRQAAGERSQMLGELGRLVDLEVDAEHRDPQREPGDVVVAGTELAAARVSRLDRPPVRRDAGGDPVGGGVQGDSGLVAVRRARDLLLDVGGRIRGRQGARCEPGAARRRTREAVDAEDAPVLATTVPGDEVPAAAEVDEGVRLDLTAAVGAVAARVGEAKALAVAAPGSDHRQ